MKAVVIYYFSGTGNTALVAGMFRQSFTELGLTVDLVPIEDVLKGKRDAQVADYDLVGFGSGVIGFTTPPVMKRFLRMLPSQTGKRAFIFRTAGGVAPINYNASRPMKAILSRKGFDVYHERLFSISSNWINRFDDDVIVHLTEATRRKVQLMCKALMNNETKHYQTTLPQRLQMGIVAHVAPLFFHVAGKDLTVDRTACTSCGLCEKKCPASNIRLRDGHVRFGWQCNSCLRCVYACPAEAIHFKHLSSFAVKGGYHIQDILAHPAPVAADKAKPAPRFYLKYLADDSL